MFPNVHDVCLVDGGHLLAPSFMRQLEGIFCDAQRLDPCDDLQALHYTRDALEGAGAEQAKSKLLVSTSSSVGTGWEMMSYLERLLQSLEGLPVLGNQLSACGFPL